jgi:hypothetical protein
MSLGITLKLDAPPTLVGKTFIETPDVKKMIKMLYVDDILETKEKKRGKHIVYENERKQIEDYLKKALIVKKQGDRLGDKEFLKMLYHHTAKYVRPEIKVKYYYGKGLENVGRVYPEGSLSLCSIRKEVRHQLCRDIYVDVDMINAHFVIASQLFRECPMVLDYVENRSKYFQMICDVFSMGNMSLIDWKTDSGYDMCKDLLIRELYYGKWNSWVKDNGLPAMDKPDWLSKLEKEFETIAEIVKRENPELLKKVEEKEDCENPNGTITSWFLQDWERRILEKLVEFFKKKKLIAKGNAVLCFDGLQILYKEGIVWTTILKEAEIHIAKELKLNIKLKIKPFDDKRYTDRLNAIEIPFADDEADSFTIVEDDEEAGTVLMGRLEDCLKFSKGQIFFKNNHIWTANAGLTRTLLINYIQQSKIYKEDSKGNTVSYAQNYSNAKNIYETLIGKVKETPDDEFYNKLHTSSVGMLCFEDGVLNLITKKFHRWESDHFKIKENEVFSCVQINRPFEKWFLKPDQEIIKKVEAKVFDAIMGSQKTRFLQFISRAFAGHYTDKDWSVFIGNRNCGKGTLDGFMKTAFGGYTKTIPSDNLLCERGGKNGDVAKAMSWAIDLQFIRLATTQEIQLDNENKNVKLNSIMIKKLASGGDEIEGRKNYQDEMTFTIDAKILMMANDMPPTSTEDVKEHLVEFKTTQQFKDKRWIDERRTELEELVKLGADEQILNEMKRYVEGDDEVKLNCVGNIDWANALISLVLKYYTPSKLVIETSQESNGDNLCCILLQRFKITNCETDFISNKKLKDVYYPQMDILDSYKKMRIELLSFDGVKEHKKNGERGLKGLVYIYGDTISPEEE